MFLYELFSVIDREISLINLARMQDDRATESRQIEESKSNPECFEAIYIKYYEPILKFVYKRIENLNDCRDVTSTVFAKALINIRKYKDFGFPFSSWLYRIATNEVTQFYRNKSKIRIISIDENSIQNLIEETGNKNTEHVAVLKKSLLYLSEEELTLIELRYFEDRPFSEVSQILKITEGNAKVRTYRVIDKLKKIYAKLS